MPLRRGLPEMALTVVAVGATLAALEAGCRARAWYQDRGVLERVLHASARPARGASVTLGQMLRPSRNPRIIYELWPRMDVLFFMGRGDGGKNRVRTGAAGFRGADHALEKPVGTLRIVGIGDSLMFGWGVEEGQEYLSLLEQRLNAERPERRWEVINTGVPGYNTVMEVETLKEKALAYHPDLVVVGFCPNDASLPNFIRSERDVLSLRESYLVRFVEGLLEPPPPPGDALQAAPRRAADGVGFEDDPGRLPPLYRGLAGWDAYRNSLQELKTLARTERFKTLVLAFVPDGGPEKSKGLAIAAEAGFPVIDVGERQRAYMAAHGIEDYWASRLVNSSLDPHPSPISHEMAADALLAAVRQAVPE